MRRTRSVASLALAILAGCGRVGFEPVEPDSADAGTSVDAGFEAGAPPDAGPDGGHLDASTDAGARDAGRDAGMDAGRDAGMDAALPDAGDAGSGSCALVTLGGNDYLFCSELRTWLSAQDRCAAEGGGLVVIDDATENVIVTDEAVGRLPFTFWIGLSDLDTEGTFRWVDGTAVTYASWAGSEPNDFGGIEDCAACPEHVAYGWNDLPCSNLKPFVCELP